MYYAGLDLGQRRDHTAIAVVERAERTRGYAGPAFLAYAAAPAFEGLMVRHVERVPLGTPYPEVVARIREIVLDDELRGRCALAVDATGVGNPVVDMLRAAGLGCEISAVTITGGDKESRWGSAWSVPKRDLIAGVQVLLESGGLRIARRLREVGPLIQELVDMRMTSRGTGRVRVGANGCGEHDDLVIALALACWRAKRRESGFGGARLPGI